VFAFLPCHVPTLCGVLTEENSLVCTCAAAFISRRDFNATALTLAVPLLGFVSETATFIAECGEDENDTVVKESFKLKEAVESIAGTIEGL